jgi:CRP/FNR family transcriptional regulator
MPVQPDALRQALPFAVLQADDLAHVAAITAERRYTRGEILILAGEEGGGLYFVREGRVKVFRTSDDGKEQTLRLISAGQTFNDVPALDGGPNPASAMALESTVVLITSGEQLRRLIMERPGIAVAMVQTLATALRALVSLVDDLSFRHVRARVAKILLEREQEEQPLAGSGDAHQFQRRLTQQEIAALAGTTREVVGRALKALEGTGAIAMAHGRVTVTSRESLRILAL